jgi:outer membrane protein OmpA-like peptidoglycan-associated protein
MKNNSVVLTTLVILCTTGSQAQPPAERTETVPIYRVTVVERTLRAVNYQYRTGPTKVDFRGTVLLPEVKGDATVESKRGRTELDAKFEHMAPPTRFGREYLTYVLWAITPEGHARNLGEVIADGNDHAKLRVTTDLQSFGLIVTAEPYSAVRLPSDVVVAENEIRPDTMGTTEPIQAKYDLLPRGHYVYNKPVDLQFIQNGGPKLSMDDYESVLEVYQAQNAVQIAASVGAAEYAADTYAKADQLLREAQARQARRAGVSAIVSVARQAAQTAEDARAIALRRKQDAELVRARDDAAAAQRQQAEAEAAARRAESDAAAVRANLEQERAAREQADRVAQAPAPTTMIEQPQRAGTEPMAVPSTAEVRARVLQQLNAVLPALDTPRGLVVMLPDTYFHSTTLDPAIYSRLSSIASIVRAQPGLMVEVEGHTDDRGDAVYLERVSAQRAGTIQHLLVRQGIPQGQIVARGYGRSRPIASNATVSGREQNRRVEIIISGAPIGNMATWDRTYSVVPPR